MSFDAWYYEIPTITRWYLTLSVLTTAACFFDIISPFSLYLNFRLIVEKYEVRARTSRPRLSAPHPPAACRQLPFVPALLSTPSLPLP